MTVRGRNGGTSPVGQIDSRALILIGAAVIIGLLLLARGFDSGADSGSAGEVATDDGSATDGDGAVTDGGTDSTTTLAPTDGGTDTAATDGTDTTATDGAVTDDGSVITAETRLPAEIQTLAVNATGETGIAGTMEDKLISFGYLSGTADGVDASLSQILYRDGYDADALALAVSLGVPGTSVALLTGTSDTVVTGADNILEADAAQILVVLGSDGLIR